MLAGVAAGLGERFGLDPWWFRGGFIALTLFGGLGVVLYIIGWLLMPDEGESRSIAARWMGRLDSSDGATVAGAVLIGVAVIILAGSLHFFSGQLIFAAVLFVVGVLLFRGDLRPGSTTKREVRVDGNRGEDSGEESVDAVDGLDGGVDPESNDESSEDEMSDMSLPIAPTATSATPVSGEVGGSDAGAIPPPDPSLVSPSVPAPPPRPRSILGALTMAALLIALGGLALADLAGWLYPEAWHYLATALGVVGIGLLVGTLFGRARWLIVVGLLLMPFLLVTATAAAVLPSWSFGGEFGDRAFHPVAVVELPPSYELAAGSMLVDLTDLDLTDLDGTSRPLEVAVGAGDVIVRLPDAMVGTVEARAGLGRIAANGRERVGIGPVETIRFPDAAGLCAVPSASWLVPYRLELRWVGAAWLVLPFRREAQCGQLRN
jgi:phage shock protein PspC (stress-responsive transcriptional regulator)